jgi:hypothetical protein
MKLRDIPINVSAVYGVLNAGLAIRLEQADVVLVNCNGNGDVEHGSAFRDEHEGKQESVRAEQQRRDLGKL